jgi:hypothetical protein
MRISWTWTGHIVLRDYTPVFGVYIEDSKVAKEVSWEASKQVKLVIKHNGLAAFPRMRNGAALTIYAP